ncbi:MAG TPA: LytTR family DNA-binding domain-containing protein [Flavisolibacter sp.]|nr:LytTR family DNA-binding domain-containing protein [Flavisolibacter sp.]
MIETKIIIIDDEVPARVLLRKYIEQYPYLQIVAECRNGEEAIERINSIQPDLAFLDIQMPGKTGFEVLQEINHFPTIIFSTAYDQYAIEAFNVNAIDYLLKPFTKERFDQALHKALETSKNRMLQQLTESFATSSYPERILVEQGHRLVSVALKDVMWVEAEGDYSKIHTGKQTFLSNKGISELEKRLNPSQFQRVHRSFIIALDAIQEVYKDPSGPLVLLKNNVQIKVSRSYIDVFRRLIY